MDYIVTELLISALKGLFLVAAFLFVLLIAWSYGFRNGLKTVEASTRRSLSGMKVEGMFRHWVFGPREIVCHMGRSCVFSLRVDRGFWGFRDCGGAPFLAGFTKKERREVWDEYKAELARTAKVAMTEMVNGEETSSAGS